MKKTFTINLGGIVFNIDEDAYELLKTYLENLRQAFANEPESDDIVADIETRICEILIEDTCQGKRVVELHMVEQVISRIGNPEEISETTMEIEEDTDGDIKEKKTERTFGPVPQSAPVRKRFFRDPRDKMVGGVCSGIGHYIGLDATWVRLIAVALCFASFSTLALIYIILWIVVPEAHTARQRLEMLGEPQTLQNIGQTVKETFNPGPATVPPPFPRSQPEHTESGGKRFVDSLLNIFVIIAKVILTIIGLISIPVLVALAIGIIGCIFSIVLFGGAAIGWWGASLLPCEEELFPALFCGIFAILSIGIPLLALVYAVFRNTLRIAIISKGWTITLLVIWLASLVGMTVCIGMLC